MSKPDDLTEVTRAILSDEEAHTVWYTNPALPLSKAIRAVLNAFAQRAGVTGEKYEGYAETHPGYTPFFQMGGHDVRLHGSRATLYIHPPARPVRSAEERIEEALKEHNRGAWQTAECNCRQCRILRGEGPIG
jgi:hypothetical protein